MLEDKKIETVSTNLFENEKQIKINEIFPIEITSTIRQLLTEKYEYFPDEYVQKDKWVEVHEPITLFINQIDLETSIGEGEFYERWQIIVSTELLNEDDFDGNLLAYYDKVKGFCKIYEGYGKYDFYDTFHSVVCTLAGGHRNSHEVFLQNYLKKVD